MTMHSSAEPQATIMIVDDLPDNLQLLREMLQAENYRVLAFTSGRRALDRIHRTLPDLILLDITMPEMDGYEVCRALKEDVRVQDIPVLFISALNDTQDKVKAFSVGAVDYITKPFQFEEVKMRVRTHLSLRALQVQIEAHNERLEDLVEDKVTEILESQVATIVTLSQLAESRDDHTGRHIERTRLFCRVLAEELRRHPAYASQINDHFVKTIQHAAALHDIGKVAIPDHILLKPGKLTEEEFTVMKRHPLIGAETLLTARKQYAGNEFLNMGITVARSHHERWDGTGYPDGLSGHDIPLAAQIMAVADVYDALRSQRPYKPAYPHADAVEAVRAGSGTQFNPDVVAAFLNVQDRVYVLWSDEPES